jgi:hypothetical protein
MILVLFAVMAIVATSAGCFTDDARAHQFSSKIETPAEAPAVHSAMGIRRIFAVTDTRLAPEAAAKQLMQRYLDSLRANHQKPVFRDFPFEMYDSVRLAMYPVAEAPAEYAIQSWESARTAWIIEPSLRYRYSIEISETEPLDLGLLRALYGGRYQGPIVQWSALYPGPRIGFLLTKDGDSYTLRSRYFGQDGQPR